MNNNLDSAVSKEKPVHLFIMILIFFGVCSGYYLWMRSDNTPMFKNKDSFYDGNEYKILRGSIMEPILENNIIGQKGLVSARFIMNLFSSKGELIAPLGSVIHGSFQYKKKNGFAHYVLTFNDIVTPCGLVINLQPGSESIVASVTSIHLVEAGQKIQISFLKDVDFKSILNENINVECDYPAIQKYLND